ncbi:hypothetical protein MKX03_008271 [Papaver bracteatum]|nr:hypothetical protein MKX03_008271 [Papaver bracteatum]
MPHHSFSKLAQKHGPIMYLQLGQVPTLVVSSAKLAQEILKTHDHVFSNRPQIIGAQYLSFGCTDITFSRYGPYWRQARKICVTELLSPKRVNSFHLIRNEEVDILIDSISKLSGSEVDMSEKFFVLANDVLCRVAFGKRFISDDESNRLPKVLTVTQELFSGFCIADFYPGLEWINSVTGLKKKLLKNLSDLRSVCDEIISEHMNRDNNQNKTVGGGGHIPAPDREDFVDVLLRVQKAGDLEVPITDDNLKALVLVITFFSSVFVFVRQVFYMKRKMTNASQSLDMYNIYSFLCSYTFERDFMGIINFVDLTVRIILFNID